MTLSELNDLAKSRGFYPIQIAGDATDPECDNLFTGTLDEYFAAATFLGAKAIFIQNSTLTQSDFIHEVEVFNDDEDGGGGEDETKEIDLSLVNPSLTSYKKYIGVSHTFLLSAKSDIAELNKHIEEEWRKDYRVEHEKATELVEQNEEEILEKMEEARIKKDKELLKLVKDLISDAEFVKISTQGGMKSYALEKYPQLEGINSKVLVQEIRLVNDKIKAKGLHKKNALS